MVRYGDGLHTANNRGISRRADSAHIQNYIKKMSGEGLGFLGCCLKWPIVLFMYDY